MWTSWFLSSTPAATASKWWDMQYKLYTESINVFNIFVHMFIKFFYENVLYSKSGIWRFFEIKGKYFPSKMSNKNLVFFSHSLSLRNDVIFFSSLNRLMTCHLETTPPTPWLPWWSSSVLWLMTRTTSENLYQTDWFRRSRQASRTRKRYVVLRISRFLWSHFFYLSDDFNTF